MIDYIICIGKWCKVGIGSIGDIMEIMKKGKSTVLMGNMCMSVKL